MTGARQAESPLILLTAASMLLCFQMICIFHWCLDQQNAGS